MERRENGRNLLVGREREGGSKGGRDGGRESYLFNFIT